MNNTDPYNLALNSFSTKVSYDKKIIEIEKKSHALIVPITIVRDKRTIVLQEYLNLSINIIVKYNFLIKESKKIKKKIGILNTQENFYLIVKYLNSIFITIKDIIPPLINNIDLLLYINKIYKEKKLGNTEEYKFLYKNYNLINSFRNNVMHEKELLHWFVEKHTSEQYSYKNLIITEDNYLQWWWKDKKTNNFIAYKFSLNDFAEIIESTYRLSKKIY